MEVRKAGMVKWISLNLELLNTKIKFLPPVYKMGIRVEVKTTEENYEKINYTL